MGSMIKRFWRRLDHAVHPEDKFILTSNPHSFNLEFPPPAFIGDVDHAPIVILMANGGYNPNPATGTPSEFSTPRDHKEHLDMLRGDGVCIPRSLSPYYTQNPLFPWVRDGKAVIVNAVAYRSPKLSQEPNNQRLVELLPSVRVHRQWLHEEVIPAAALGKRFIVAHRWKWWNFPKGSVSIPNVRHSKSPISETLSRELRAELEAWLVNG